MNIQGESTCRKLDAKSSKKKSGTKGGKGSKSTKDSDRETWTKSKGKSSHPQKPRLTAFEEYALEAQQAQPLMPEKPAEQLHKRGSDPFSDRKGKMDVSEFQRLKEYEAQHRRGKFVY